VKSFSVAELRASAPLELRTVDVEMDDHETRAGSGGNYSLLYNWSSVTARRLHA